VFRPILKNLGFLIFLKKPKNLKSGNVWISRLFNSRQFLYFLKSKSVNLFELIGVAIISHPHQSSVWVNLRFSNISINGNRNRNGIGNYFFTEIKK